MWFYFNILGWWEWCMPDREVGQHAGHNSCAGRNSSGHPGWHGHWQNQGVHEDHHHGTVDIR